MEGVWKLSILDSMQIINLAQLVSPSVALLAELVLIIIHCFGHLEIIDCFEHLDILDFCSQTDRHLGTL